MILMVFPHWAVVDTALVIRGAAIQTPVSYTHLTLPTNREV